MFFLLNLEMRSLITTLQTNNKLLKSDNIRTKKRLEESLQEADKLRKQASQHHHQQVNKSEPLTRPVVKTESQQLTEGGATPSDVKKEEFKSESGQLKDSQIKDLKEQNQKLADDKKVIEKN